MRGAVGALGLGALLSGCGGGAGSGVLDTGAFAGGYSAAFDRAGTTVLAVTDAVGGFSVALSDGNGVLGQGSGTVAPTGAVVARLTGALGTVEVAGTFELIDAEPRLTLDFGGDVSASGLTLTRIASPGVNPFAANYEGVYGGEASGSWSVTVSERGSASGIVRDPSAGALSVTGQVTPLGEATWSAAAAGGDPPVVRRWTGRFFFVGQTVRAFGVWRSSEGLSGDWAGRRD